MTRIFLLISFSFCFAVDIETMDNYDVFTHDPSESDPGVNVALDQYSQPLIAWKIRQEARRRVQEMINKSLITANPSSISIQTVSVSDILSFLFTALADSESPSNPLKFYLISICGRKVMAWGKIIMSIKQRAWHPTKGTIPL
jgi:hypothetical protein